MAKKTPIHSPAHPGVALRALRKRNDWTLAEIAQRTGLPVSTLSKIETGKMSLSYDKLSRLSAGLNMDIAQLFEPHAGVTAATVTGRRSVTRAGGGLPVSTENYAHLYPAEDLLNKRFIPIVADVRARSLDEFGELIRHAGEEYAYVLEGSVDLHTDLYAPLRLAAGDSIYFDSGMGHAYIAVGAGPCRVLSICSATQSQLLQASAQMPSAQADVADVAASPAARSGSATGKAAAKNPVRKRAR